MGPRSMSKKLSTTNFLRKVEIKKKRREEEKEEDVHKDGGRCSRKSSKTYIDTLNGVIEEEEEQKEKSRYHTLLPQIKHERIKSNLWNVCQS